MSDADRQHLEASRLAFLYDIVIEDGQPWHERLDRLLAFGAASFGLQVGILARISGDDYEVVGVGPVNASLAVGDHFSLGKTYCSQTVESADVLAFHRAGGTEWERHPCFQAFGLQAYIGVRIMVNGRIWGTLSFSAWQPRTGPFGNVDRQFLALMARWIGRELEREERGRQVVRLSEWQRVILESANYAIIATDPEGLILNFNRAAEVMLGYAAEEVVGRHTPALLHDPEEVVARAAGLSAELGYPVAPGFGVFVEKARLGSSEEREWSYIRKDGSRLPVLLSVSALRDGDGLIQGYLGIAVDLTARKQLERQTAAVQAYEMSHSLVRAIAQGIVCLDPEPPYRIRFVNPHAAELLGMSEEASQGRPLAEVLDIAAESLLGSSGLLEQVKPAGGTAFDAMVRTPGRPEGFPAALSLAPADGSLLVLTLQDITARRQAEKSLRLAGRVFEVCSEAIMITDAEGGIISVNPAFTWLTGYRPDEVLGRKPSLLKSGMHDGNFYRRMWEALSQDGTWAGEVWDKRKDGSCYPKWLSINAVREDGRTSHFVAMFHDISEQKSHEGRIRHLAEHDALTGLPNRRLLERHMAQLAASARRADQRGFAVILLDLDRFKNINDTLGHTAGDQVLIEVARRLSISVRESDTVARLGGDEFVVLLPGVAAQAEVAEVVAKMHRALNEPIHFEGRSLHAPPSMGIALYPADGEDIDTLLKNADAAMYRTKSNGRNGWTFFVPDMNRRLRERLGLEEALRHALRAGGLELHYQPQMGEDGQVVCWEALLRWPHPQLGNVPPEHVISVAEETGLIHALGAWVVRTACADCRAWESAGHGRFRVGVNVSPLQLGQADFATVVAQALDQAGLRPERLEIEITENILVERSLQVAKNLEALRRLGVTLTLDDFGTGYSSLGYLKTLAVDRVKIDRSFVRNVASSRSDASIVQAVLMLAENLELAVVAEGVETAEQQDFLRRSGCREMQGFLLAHPMPAAAVAGFVASLGAAAPA